MKNFDARYVDIENLQLYGRYENTLIFNCSIHNLENVQLLNCDLNYSKLLIDNIINLRNFSCTMNCGTFENVELSPLIFDLILMLLIKSRGNEQRRKRLFRMLGVERIRDLGQQMDKLEL